MRRRGFRELFDELLDPRLRGDDEYFYSTFFSQEGRRKSPTNVPAAASLPSLSKMISRLPKGSALPAITSRVRFLSHSNCRINPVAGSSTICSRMLHSAPLGLTGMAFTSLHRRIFHALF